jgi:hypothetical protein
MLRIRRVTLFVAGLVMHMVRYAVILIISAATAAIFLRQELVRRGTGSLPAGLRGGHAAGRLFGCHPPGM